MVAEEARLTDSEAPLSENAMVLLNQKLNLISDVIEDGIRPELAFTVFVPDQKKSGGKYVNMIGTVKKIDTVYRKVILVETEGLGRMNRMIDFDRIADIHGSLVDYLDDVE